MNTFLSLLAQIGDDGRRGAGGVLFGAVVALVVLLFGAIFFGFFFVSMRAHAAGVRVTFVELIALRLRSLPAGMIVDTLITAIKSGLNMTIDDLSTHHLSGGNVQMVVIALIAAHKAGIHLEFDRACAIDLATKGTGKSLLDAVRSAVNPKIIDCPDPDSGKITIDAAAKDGTVVKARAVLTVRTNLYRFIGGADEQTLVSRVSEGIAHGIGCHSAREILEDPERLSQAVLHLGLDKNAALEILSLKIEVIRSS